MELTPATASGYVHLAFEQMLAVAERLGDERVNERPISAQTNAVAPLRVPHVSVGDAGISANRAAASPSQAGQIVRAERGGRASVAGRDLIGRCWPERHEAGRPVRSEEHR